MDIERLRNRYRPRKVSVLFVGESPPARNFFYMRKGPLYESVRDVFVQAFGGASTRDEDFLDFFESKGCWLEDLLKQRGKKMDDSEPEEIEEGVERLSGLIRQERPEVVIVVIKRIATLVEKAVDRRTTRFHVLPFPAYWRGEFVRGVKKILTDIANQHR